MKVPQAIKTSCEAIYDNLPTKKTIVKSALAIATSAVAVEAIASLTVASAGPITYALCVAACATAAPPALPACLAACAIGLGPWCP